MVRENRFYSPDTGRFISSDPLGFVDGPNTYGFCGGDPVNRSDPMGTCSRCGHWWCFAGEWCAPTGESSLDPFIKYGQDVQDTYIGEAKGAAKVGKGIAEFGGDMYLGLTVATTQVVYGNDAAVQIASEAEGLGWHGSELDKAARDEGAVSVAAQVFVAPIVAPVTTTVDAGAAAWNAKPGEMQVVGDKWGGMLTVWTMTLTPFAEKPVTATPTPKTAVGRRGNPMGTSGNSPTTIAGREYTGHAIDQMQSRGIPPSAVENTIRSPQSVSAPGNKIGTTTFTDTGNGVTVVTDSATGRVVTVILK